MVGTGASGAGGRIVMSAGDTETVEGLTGGYVCNHW